MLQLEVLLPQIERFRDRVRLLVSDNASNNPLVMPEGYSCLSNVEFRRNSGNIGGNANIALGFVFAQPKEFLWILSDNDIITEGAVGYLIEVIDKNVDLYCFNDLVESPLKKVCSWQNDGCQTLMDWRVGLISDALYNVSSIQESIESSFYYHNSSFPHLGVAFATLKRKRELQCMLLPRNDIHQSMATSTECPTDYSLAHVCMPLLLPLFNRQEAKSFALKWLRENGVDFYRNRKQHYHLYLDSKATLICYGGWKASFLLVWKWPVYFVVNPIRVIRRGLIVFVKKHLSTTAVTKLKRVRNRF